MRPYRIPERGLLISRWGFCKRPSGLKLGSFWLLQPALSTAEGVGFRV